MILHYRFVQCLLSLGYLPGRSRYIRNYRGYAALSRVERYNIICKICKQHIFITQLLANYVPSLTARYSAQYRQPD
jgi:hypothetical protein